MSKSDGLKPPLCRHCLERVNVQSTIDGGRVYLNVNGSPHKCQGYLDELREKAERPLYERIRTPEPDVRPAVRNSDPETSHEAWDKAKTKAANLRYLIADALHKSGTKGLTISEIAWALGYGDARDSISPRMSEMETRGLAIRTAAKRVPGPGLSSQTIWVHPDCTL